MQILVILTIIALLAYAALMIWYAIRWKGNTPLHVEDSTASFSIIIPARNESANIENLIRCAMDQDYNTELFEVIVVDDHSTDETVDIINNLKNTFRGLKLLKLSETESSKKTALAAGISQASGKFIITIDADCSFGPGYLRAISSEYSRKHCEMIIAPVVIRPQKSFISLFQSLDFLALQAITMTGVHQLCNGANLSFSKEAFLNVDGYKGINDIASGDDVLLLDKFSKKYPGKISILKDQMAMVETLPVRSWKDFIQQRIRWSGKWQKLPLRDISVLSFVFFINVMLFILLICSFIVPFPEFRGMIINTLLLWLILVAIKCCSEMLLMIPASKFFGLRKYMFRFPFMQPVHIIYTSVAGLLGLKGNYTWKDRDHK